MRSSPSLNTLLLLLRFSRCIIRFLFKIVNKYEKYFLLGNHTILVCKVFESFALRCWYKSLHTTVFTTFRFLISIDVMIIKILRRVIAIKFAVILYFDGKLTASVWIGSPNFFGIDEVSFFCRCQDILWI